MKVRFLFVALAGACLATTGAAAVRHTADPLSRGAHRTALAGVDLHYVVRGSGPIIFVTSPGWGIGSLYLQRTMIKLERHATVIYVDTRGSGGSSRPNDRSKMSQAVMADDIDLLRQKLGLREIALLGHSDGGTIALEYAERHPDHLAKLILVDPWVQTDPDTRKYMESTLSLWATDPHYKASVETARGPDPSPMTDAAFAQQLDALMPLYLSDPDRFLPVMRAALRGVTLSSYAMVAENEARRREKHDLLKGAGAIRAKTLIINGTVDWICPYQVAQHLADAIPGARLSLYANKGHLPWIEDPRRFFQEVAIFIRS